MYSRYFLSFCILALFVIFVANVKAQEAEDRSAISKVLVKAARTLLKKNFVGAAASCIEEAIESCKSDLKHAKQLVKCAGHFFKENKGICLVD